MTINRTRVVLLSLVLLASACGPKRPAATPAPPAVQNVFLLLPEPTGESSGIVVRNQAGTQDLTLPYQAVHVDRIDTAPSAPVILDQAEVRRVFGAAIDTLPQPEVAFTLHFDEGREVLNDDSVAQIPAILKAIHDRNSTAITVTGHTDTVPIVGGNYQLGLKRARTVVDILKARGVNESDIFASSHGDADLLIKTGPNKGEPQNRRVEVIVR